MAEPHRTPRSAAKLLWLGIALAASGCADDPASLPVPTAGHPCPVWVLFPPSYFSNADSPYLGCTIAVNLRANVANPADLEIGRPLGPADGQRETLAVETYQQGKIKPLPASSSTSINASGPQ
ncbi:MAG TPA: CpaD family pilus assembly lipoprotein [Acetobacteraceae bacterium]|jgi:type IV pilus biogenesis protein CpaD/CtpE